MNGEHSRAPPSGGDETAAEFDLEIKLGTGSDNSTSRDVIHDVLRLILFSARHFISALRS